METSSATSTGSTLPAAADSSSGEVIGKVQFLNLLVAQLTHQDPMNPMEGTEFTAQLAQFTSLEQLMRINESLGTLAQLESSLTRAQAVGMIGKQILAEGNTIAMVNGISSNVIFSLDKATDSASVSVFNESGDLVSVVDTNSLPAGQNSIAFAGFDRNGDPLPDGIYTFEVLALDAEGESIGVQSFSSGIVSGVNIEEDGTTNLQIGTTEFSMGSVIQITEPEPVDPAP